MKIFVLTGSIAMGKTTVAKYLEKFNIKIFCADKAIHKIYEQADIIDYIKTIYEPAIVNNKVERKILAKYILNNENIRLNLEKLLYKELEKEKIKFLIENTKEKLIIFDIPLYFEKNNNKIIAEKPIDKIIVVYCDKELQIKRALQRPNLTEDIFYNICKLQLPIEEKIKNADYIINNNGTLEETYNQINYILKKEEINDQT